MSLVLQDELLISPKLKEQVIQNTADIKVLEDKIKTGVYKFKGSVQKYSDLPKENNEIGDVYNIKTSDKSHGISAGDNVAWDGEDWDNLGSYIDLEPYALQADLELERNTRINADDTLTNDLNTEINARVNADSSILTSLDNINTTLDNKIDTEINIRSTNDDTILSKLWSKNKISNINSGYFQTKNIQSDESYGQIWNENSGGGVLYYNKPLNISSFVGVNKSSNSDKVDVQIYAKDKTSNIGTRVNVSAIEGLYYLKNCKNLGFPAEREVVVKEDIITLNNKIDKYTTLPNSNEEVGKIVQYIGETNTYTNSYFYKYFGEPGLTFTPIEDTYTITVNTTIEDFKVLLTRICEGRPFTAEDIIYGQIGYYSAERLSFSANTDTNKFFHITMTPTEFEEAGVTFEPAIGPRQGVTFKCNLNNTAWKQTNVQPNQDLSSYALKSDLPTKTSQLTNDSDYTTNEALQVQVANLTQQIKDLKLLIPQEVFDPTTARSAMNASGKVTLCEDIDLGKLNLGGGVFANYNTSINLNGHTLQSGPTGGRALLLVRGTSHYTFNGKGQVIDTADDSSPVWCASENASVTINDGTFIAQGHMETIYCELGTININGGVFKTEHEDKHYVLNCKDANFKAGTAKIIVKGGEFWDFDPSANPEGPDTSYVAAGYTVTSREENGHIIYTVIKA